MKKKKMISGLALVAMAFVGSAAESVWEYDPAAQTLSDGTWTLMATNTSGKCLRLGLGEKERTDGRTGAPWAFPAAIDTLRRGRLDLTGAIYTKGQEGVESKRWAITEVMDNAFDGISSGIVTAFIAPTTLTKYGMQTFYTTKGLTNAVFNCPELTGTFCIWGNDFAHSDITRLVLHLPNVTKVGNNEQQVGNFNTSTLAETDLSSWDLTRVKVVGFNALRAGGNKRRSGGPKGHLALPNVETICDGAFDGWTRVSSVAFGTKGTLKSLGRTLFWNPDAKSGLAAGPTKIDFGKSWDFSVDPQAFYAELPGKVSACPDGLPLPLEEVWFAGPAPSVETLDRILVLRTPGDDGSKPLTIFAPLEDEATWRTLCRPFADETEEAAARATGKNVAGVYVRADGVRVAWLVNRTVFETVTATPRLADPSAGTVTITTNGVAVASGTELVRGTEVTVTATPAQQTTRVSWEGTLPDGTTPTDSSFTFTVGRGPSTFTAVFSRAWEYDAEAKTLSDGVWTLNATPTDANARHLKIEQTTNAVEKARTGGLNLMGRIYTKGAVGSDAARWTIVEIGYGAFNGFSIASFDAPTTLVTFGGQAFNGAMSLSRVNIQCPNLTKFGEYGFMFGNSVANLVFDVPLLGAIGKTGKDFAYETFSETDLTTWNLSGLTNVYNAGFAILGPGPKGTLSLPNINMASNFAFAGWKNLSAVALGTNGTLKALGSQIFSGNTAALKRLDFGTSAAFTAQPDTFLAAADTPLPLEEVWFAGSAPSVETLDCILAQRSVATDGTKPVKIYAPMMKPSWQVVCRPIASTERAAAQAVRRRTGHHVVGVYETQDGRRVAWLMQNPGFDYSVGCLLIIR